MKWMSVALFLLLAFILWSAGFRMSVTANMYEQLGDRGLAQSCRWWSLALALTAIGCLIFAGYIAWAW